MNKVLETTRIFVAPALVKKRRLYKVSFFASIFLVCILFSYYIYGEFDRNSKEQISQGILADAQSQIQNKSGTQNQNENNDNTMYEGNVNWQVSEEDIENEVNEDVAQEQQREQALQSVATGVSKSGDTYSTIAIINIPKINVNYPILNKTTDELLKIAPTKFWGSEPNEIGNFCIVGHNYRTDKFFSKIEKLEKDDIIEITDMSGRTLKYGVYDKFIVEPDNTASTSQLTRGKKEITLITCTTGTNQRTRSVIKAREVN